LEEIKEEELKKEVIKLLENEGYTDEIIEKIKRGKLLLKIEVFPPLILNFKLFIRPDKTEYVFKLGRLSLLIGKGFSPVSSGETLIIHARWSEDHVTQYVFLL